MSNNYKHASRHLEITDLPSDRDGILSNFRTILIAVFNKARGNDARMNLLAITLKLVLAHIENDRIKPKKGKK